MSTFIKVPTFVMELACAGDISPQALRLYVVLRSYQNHENRVSWPSALTLAKRMGMKHRQGAQRYIDELVTAGAVARTTRRGTSSVYSFPDVLRQSDNAYVVTLPESDNTGVVTPDDFSDDFSWGDNTGVAPVTTHTLLGDNAYVAPSDNTCVALTRSSELDQVTRPSEEEKPSSRAKSSPGAVDNFVAATAPTPVIQPPLMAVVPDLPPEPQLDDRGREILGRGMSGWTEAIEYVNDHRPVGHELTPSEERDLRDALRARTAPEAVLRYFTSEAARQIALKLTDNSYRWKRTS